MLRILKFLLKRPTLLGILLIIIGVSMIIMEMDPVKKQDELKTVTGSITEALKITRKDKVEAYKITVANNFNWQRSFRLEPEQISEAQIHFANFETVTVRFHGEQLYSLKVGLERV